MDFAKACPREFSMANSELTSSISIIEDRKDFSFPAFNCAGLAKTQEFTTTSFFCSFAKMATFSLC